MEAADWLHFAALGVASGFLVGIFQWKIAAVTRACHPIFRWVLLVLGPPVLTLLIIVSLLVLCDGRAIDWLGMSALLSGLVSFLTSLLGSYKAMKSTVVFRVLLLSVPISVLLHLGLMFLR